MLEVASVFKFPCSSVFQVFFFKCSTKNKGQGPASKWFKWGKDVELCCHHWPAGSVLVNTARMRTTVPFLGRLPFCAGSGMASGRRHFLCHPSPKTQWPEGSGPCTLLGPEGFHLQAEGKKYSGISWELHSIAWCSEQKDNHASSDQSPSLAEIYISLQ